MALFFLLPATKKDEEEGGLWVGRPGSAHNVEKIGGGTHN